MKRKISGRRFLAAAVLAGALLSRATGQENVALGKTARQSSGYNGPGQDGFPAGNAIDGNLGNFSHTWNGQSPAWWEVDLGDFNEISYVVLHNRGGGCCQSRHRDLTVRVLDFSGEGETVLYESPLLNPENILGGGGTGGPRFITVNLLRPTGLPVEGTVVRVTRTPDPDLSGTGGAGNPDEGIILQLGEVEVFVGECTPGAGTCSSLAINGPPSGGPGLYNLTAEGLGDPLYYQFTADNGRDPPMVFGPQEENVASLPLGPGTWTVSVSVGDNRLCPSEDPGATCSQQLTVKECSEDPPDTRCDALAVLAPHGGEFPGRYSLSAVASDDSGDPPFYTFSADNGVDPPLVAGPRDVGTAAFDLTVGNWTISASVGDNRLCPPDAAPAARCSQALTVKTLSDKPNVAPLGTASQSSEWPAPQFPASLAIDGNYGNFTHTATADAAATWEVDLGDSYAIEAIRAYNRPDCCQVRLRDLTISILDFDGVEVWTSALLNEENTHPNGSGDPYNPSSLTVSLLQEAGKPVDGKAVRIKRAADVDNSGIGTNGGLDDANVLSLGEVEVFAAPSVLPATVARDLASDSFSGAAPTAVSLTVTALVPDTPVVVREVLPDLAAATGILDGGVLTGNTIEWNLGPVNSRTLTYQIEPASSCVGVLRYGASSFSAGGKKGAVRGDSMLSRVIADRNLGEWESLDIVATGGAVEPLSAHDLLVSAAGKGIKGTSDEFRFVSRAQNGDFEIAARIDCIDDPAGTGQAGLMVRDTRDPFSAHAFFSFGAGGGAGLAGTLRGTIRRETLATRASSGMTISQKDVTALPIYLKLKRAGTRISFERSADGLTYEEVASREIGATSTQVNLRSETLVGLASTAGGDGSARFTFREVSGPEFKESPPVGPTFRRGDSDANGQIELTDAIKLLNYLFLGQTKPECLDAADTDDSGEADISDAISNLNYQFLGAVAPAPPGPTVCGLDPGQEVPDMGCEVGCP